MIEPPADMIANLERHPDLTGRLVRDVPKLADFRRKYRRNFRLMSAACLIMASMNVLMACLPNYGLWWMNFLAAGVGAWTMVFAEAMARGIGRQLNRPAAIQVARDLVGLRD